MTAGTETFRTTSAGRPGAAHGRLAPERLTSVPVQPTGTRPLRVGIVAPPFLPVPPPGYGGIERVVSVLAEGLLARGHEVTVFAAPGSATGARLVTPLSRAPALGDPASFSDELLHTTAAYLQAGAFDVVHDHTGLGPAFGAVLGGRTPVVHTLHGPWTPPARRMYGLVHERVHLVAISNAQRASNPTLRYAGVVYNGIDLPSHPFNPKKEDFLVYVGRISPEKRPELAVDIARWSGRPLAMIVKRTEPAEQSYWESVVAPRLHSAVEVLDEPPHHVKVDVLGRALAMLFPIDWPEPFGLVMTEAMACGTPVIARPLGAAPEIVEEGVTGFLRPTVEGMVDAVESAPGVAPEDCRRRVERYFSSDAMVAAYERIYRAVLTGGVAGGADDVQHRRIAGVEGGDGAEDHRPAVSRPA
jgi:glycosyltransferase involved in cell wall biosynthesis